MTAPVGDGRVCLVSGGSRGLGRQIAADLLAAGWRVATFSRSRTAFVDEAQSRHGDARFWWRQLDLADGHALGDVVREVTSRFGRIDALVNNAAVLLEGIVTLNRRADVHHALAVNLESPLLLAQHCAKVMLRQRRGDIVNISSIAGLRGQRGLSVYSATKAALDGMTRSLARELGARGIRVNGVAPGYVDTEMTAAMPAEQRAKILRRTPLGRLGTLEDVSHAVQFLLSPAAQFITGQTLVVDGGLTC